MRRLLWLAATAGIVLSGCGAPRAAAPPHRAPAKTPHTTASAPPANTTSPPSAETPPQFPDAASRSCAAALHALGVPTNLLSLPTSVTLNGATWQTVTLPETLTGGPQTTEGGESSLQAAYLNLLSSASGYPLTPYLGTSAVEVNLAGGVGTLADYSCLEQDGKVIGLWGQQTGYTLQPEFLVTVQGKTVADLTGKDFLSWLISQGYYTPHGEPNSPSFTAEQALENFFAVINDPTLSTSERADLLDTYNPLAQQGTGWSEFAALVPMAISVATLPGGSAPDPAAPEYGVQLWPHFVTGQPTPGEMAGNGWQYMFFDLGRSSSGLWLVEGTATGG